MVVGATSSTSSLSPRKSCIFASMAISASLLKASENWLDWLDLPSLLGWLVANRHLPSAVFTSKVLPEKVVSVFFWTAAPMRAAPNFSRVR